MDVGEAMSERERDILNICKLLDLKIDPSMFIDWGIRRDAYRRWGYTDKAFDDDVGDIRFDAYRMLGYTEKAFDDDDWTIRREAYLVFGYTEKALNDEDAGIREEAEEYFELKVKCDSNKDEAKRKIEMWMLEKL